MTPDLSVAEHIKHSNLVCVILLDTNARQSNATSERMHTITPERVSTPITRQHTDTITRAPAHHIEADTKNDL